MNKVKEVSSKYKYCFVLASSSNIDKIQSIAGVVCKGKYFLMDEFQKHILEIAETYDNYTFHKNMTFGYNIKERNSEVYKEYVRKHPDKTCLIYSMWSGYLEYKGIRELYDLGRNKRMIDSSGHVLVQDLNEFIDVLKPEKIVVIHTVEDGLELINAKDRLIGIRDGEIIYKYRMK